MNHTVHGEDVINFVAGLAQELKKRFKLLGRVIDVRHKTERDPLEPRRLTVDIFGENCVFFRIYFLEGTQAISIGQFPLDPVCSYIICRWEKRDEYLTSNERINKIRERISNS